MGIFPKRGKRLLTGEMPVPLPLAWIVGLNALFDSICEAFVRYLHAPIRRLLFGGDDGGNADTDADGGTDTEVDDSSGKEVGGELECMAAKYYFPTSFAKPHNY